MSDVAGWIEAKVGGSNVYSVDGGLYLSCSDELLLGECSRHERARCGLDVFELESEGVEGIGEDGVGRGFSWKDGDGIEMRLLDNFLLVDEDGCPVSCEYLDGGGKLFMYGTVVEPYVLGGGEVPLYWKRKQLSSLKRSGRLEGVVCKEWCIDLTYGDESLWLISESGIWYKLRGEHGPGSVLKPCPVYLEAFREARMKYEACLSLSRILQDPKFKRQTGMPTFLDEATALSALGEWKIDDVFILSRASFIAKQVEGVQNFHLKGEHVHVGARFAEKLLKRQDVLIKKIMQAEERAAHRKRLRDERIRDQEASNSEDYFEFLAKRSRFTMDQCKFPLEDPELVGLLFALERGDAKPPGVLRTTKFPWRKGWSDPLKACPLPPKPDDLGLSLSNNSIGSILSSYQALHLVGNYLNLSSFSLQQLLLAVAYHPVEVMDEHVEVPPPMPSFTSPLFVEIILRLMRFIFAQPEHVELRQRILGEIDHDTYFTNAAWRAGVFPILTKLTWPYVMVKLLRELEGVVTPDELGKTRPVETAAEKQQLLLEDPVLNDPQYPRTATGYFLEEAKEILKEVLEDPNARLFMLKVDPVLLGIPDYYNVIKSPMDFGTILDRLHCGFYCEEKIQLVKKSVQWKLSSVIPKVLERLCSEKWTNATLQRARGLATQERQMLPVYRLLLGTTKEYRGMLRNLERVVEERSKEESQREEHRTKVFESIPTDFSQLVDVKDLLALQGLEPVEPVVFQSLPLGIKINDATTTTRIKKGTRYEEVLDLFSVQVSDLIPEQASRHPGLLENVRSGHRIISIGNTITASMDNAHVATIFRDAQFPLKVVFARPCPNPYHFKSVPLDVDSFEEKEEEEEEEEEEEDDDGRGGGIDAFYADVQLVFQNCLKFNNKRSTVSVHAIRLKDLFDNLYQSRVLDRMDRVQDVRKQARSSSEVTPELVVESLLFYDSSQLPASIRCWVLEWLIANMLQTNEIRLLIETGTPSEVLAARLMTGVYPASLPPPPRSSNIFDSHMIVPGPLERLQPLGEDRFLNRYWWFDGDLEGRVFVQISPSSKHIWHPEHLSAGEQLGCVKERTLSLVSSTTGHEPFRWGFISTKKGVDALVKALNPLGRRELGLLKQLGSLYRRIVSRMSGGASDVNHELMAKVSYGEEVSMYGRKKTTVPTTECPVANSSSLSTFQVVHTCFKNNFRPRVLEGSARPEVLFDQGNLVPTRQLGDLLLSPPDILSNRDLVVSLLESLEQTVWEARPYGAYPSSWTWRTDRLAWRSSLQEIALGPNKSRELWGEGQIVPPVPGRNSREELATLIKLLLRFENEGVSYWDPEDYSGSRCGTCVCLQWRLDRWQWRRRVKNSATLSELAILIRTLAVEGIRWEDTERSLNVLYVQHQPNEDDDYFDDDDDEVELVLTDGMFLDVRDDVSFGQVVSQKYAAQAFGYVAMGAFLGSFLHSALFSNKFSSMNSAHARAASKVASIALWNAERSARFGTIGLQCGYIAAGGAVESEPEHELVKNAFNNILTGISLRPRDVAEQLDSSQSHLNLWLSSRGVDNVDRKRFESRVVNWIRVKNRIHGWVKPHDVLGVDIHAGITPIPTAYVEWERAAPSYFNRVREALLPLIYTVVVSQRTDGDGAHQGYSRTIDQEHPYGSAHKSMNELSWDNVIPFTTPCASPRVQASELGYNFWISLFSPPIQTKLLCAGFNQITVGSEVVYYPEGHAFANAHAELCMGAQILRNCRQAAYGPSITNIPHSRLPIVCRVESVKFHAALPSTENHVPSPYCEMKLSPLEHQPQIDMLEIAGVIPGARPIRTVLSMVLLHLSIMPDAVYCRRQVSGAVYKDLHLIIPEQDVIDLGTIEANVANGKYPTTSDFVDDLERMENVYRVFFLQARHYSPTIAQAAANIVFRAKLLLRHPETLCLLKEDQTFYATPDDKTLTLVLRPQYEASIPSYIVDYPTLCSTITRPNMRPWKIGMRVTKRTNTKKNKTTGRISGFRFPLSSDRQLAWATIIVDWDANSLCDQTIDMPNFANKHVNPWDITG
eukprot:CAMPEP_0203758754 /NCGR_PEP_ID=MMETSP0098-20131031/11590_1 /ASSEMBLY_ACC=CAM_ASM_000208 /TAXON_ID=96639 /ORGANISM=" , Strain NY0313808BC1" /LENGTH=2033 /DNA_ID=CAMNT_0050651333 /DNA_START=61 /DNA_END=6162 /DNA_ORIENTATION=+